MRIKYVLIALTGMSFLGMKAASVLTAHGEKTYSLADSRNVPLDHKLLEIMNFRNGVFIEVGALDGNDTSNTKLFEEFYGWTGVLIEPSPNLFAQLCANRPKSKCFKCALGSFDQDGSYAYGDFDGKAMSSLVGRTGRPANVRVLLRSLQSVLDECNICHVHFFSLDTEGYELNILKGIDFNKTVFDYMLIEIYNRQFAEIVMFLDERGYHLMSRFSDYNKVANPRWDGKHNDYLFRRRDLNDSY